MSYSISVTIKVSANGHIIYSAHCHKFYNREMCTAKMSMAMWLLCKDVHILVLRIICNVLPPYFFIIFG